MENPITSEKITLTVGHALVSKSFKSNKNHYLQAFIFELPSLKMFLICSYFFYQFQPHYSYEVCSYKKKLV